MQHSKSLGSLALSCVDSDREHLLPPNRPRKRSSLDTFVISGRTRIPSHKSDLFDVELTQNLLRSGMNRLSDPPPYTERPNRTPDSHSQRHSLHPKHDAPPVEYIHDVARDPAHADSQGELNAAPCIPSRRKHHVELASNNPYRLRVSSSVPSPGQTLDGTQEYNSEARITSTTWSTISKVSRRIFSDSSDTSRAYTTAKYNHAFNELAARYALQQLTIPSHGKPK